MLAEWRAVRRRSEGGKGGRQGAREQTAKTVAAPCAPRGALRAPKLTTLTRNDTAMRPCGALRPDLRGEGRGTRGGPKMMDGGGEIL